MIERLIAVAVIPLWLTSAAGFWTGATVHRILATLES